MFVLSRCTIRGFLGRHSRSGTRPRTGREVAIAPHEEPDRFHEWSQMVSRGTTQQSSAPYNRRIVLDVIRRQGSISRKEIVDKVSLSPQTVANITSDLESIGLIVSRRLKVEK